MFYANLLTKNIAMGGDVEGSALSAYTAGSQRQSEISSSTAVDAPIMLDKDTYSVKNGGGGKRKYGSGVVDGVIETEISSSGSNRSRMNDDARFNEERAAVREETESRDNFSECISADVAFVAHLSKAEIISSARQRFLDRKIASSENSK